MTSRAQNDSQSCARRGRQSWKGTSRCSQHETKAKTTYAHAKLLHSLRRELPCLTQVRLEDRLPAVGFRWLVCSDGHWSYVQPVAPGAVELAPVRYDGVAFETFSRAHLRVDEVLGELYWLVQEGERVFGEDYIAPPAMLSCETSDTEQTWSLNLKAWTETS